MNNTVLPETGHCRYEPWQANNLSYLLSHHQLFLAYDYACGNWLPGWYFYDISNLFPTAKSFVISVKKNKNDILSAVP